MERTVSSVSCYGPTELNLHVVLCSLVQPANALIPLFETKYDGGVDSKHSSINSRINENKPTILKHTTIKTWHISISQALCDCF